MSKSLQELDCLADRVRLHRQKDKRSVVIVEGPTDERVLSRAFHDENLIYFPAGTRSLALSAAQQLDEWGQHDFACVVDRDFDDEVQRAESICSLIHPYENADLEAMLAVSRAGIDLVHELGSTGKIESRGGVSMILARLYEMVEPVSRLRRANVENAWGLAFDRVEISGKVDKKELKLKVESYCAALHQESCGSPGQSMLMEYATGARKLMAEPSCPRGSSPYFRGRDLVALLAVALCGYCGSKRAQTVVPDNLEESLRLAGAYHIRTSQWGRELREMLASSSSNFSDGSE